MVCDRADDAAKGAVAIIDPPTDPDVARAQLRSIVQRLDPRRGLAALELQTPAGVRELQAPRPSPKRVLTTGARAFVASTSNRLRPGDWVGARVLVVGVENRATKPVVEALRASQALALGATLEDFDRDLVRALDPSVLLVDPLVLDRAYDFSERARDPRLRWASLLVTELGRVSSEASVRAVLTEALPYLLYADRRVSTALLRRRAVVTRLELLGPSRLLRAARDGAVIELHTKRGTAHVRLVEGHIASARFTSPEREEALEDGLAIGAVLSLGSGRAMVRPLEEHERDPGIGLGIDAALGDSFLGTLRVMGATIAPPPLKAALRPARSLPELDAVTPGVSIYRGRHGSLRRGEDRHGHEWLIEELRRDASRAEVDTMWATVARLEQLEDEAGLSGLAFPTHTRPDFRSVGRRLEVSGTLHELVGLGWRMEHRFAVLEQIATALGPLHDAGLVHGALCPDTIVLDRDLAPWIGGASFAVPTGTEGSATVAEGARFAAPEIRDGGIVTSASDIYSLGRLLLFLVGADTNLSDDLDLAESGTCPAPEVLRIAQKATAVYPESRFRSAEAFAAALARMRPAVAGRPGRRAFTQRLRRQR
jgi:hypothetical protein